MRRLLFLILLGLGLVGTALPPAAAPAAAAMPAHGHGLMPPGHCGGGDRADCNHACLGCALEPGEPASLAPRPARPLRLARRPDAPTLPSRSAGTDPPPPRRG